MKKIISIILCLAMVFALGAASFAAVAGAGFIVYKTDAEGNPLAGAEFVLVNENGYEEKRAYSDEEGVAGFNDVMDGTYVIKEKNAPDGYIKSDAEYTIYVVNGQVITGYEPDDSGNTNPINYAPVTFVNEKEETDPITIYVPFTKIVERAGFKNPGKETFAFEIYGFNHEGAVTVVSNTIETNGAGTYCGDIVIEVETEDVVLEGFCVREINGGSYGWTYSDAVWEVMPVFDPNGGWTGDFEYTIVENGDPVTYGEMIFVNSYAAFSYAPANPAPSVPEEIEENPDTGAPVFAVSAIVIIAGAAVSFGKRK